MSNLWLTPRLRRAAVFVLALLAVEFLDEFVYGAREAAWPIIRTDLRFSYEQVGLILSLPGLIGNLIEPGLGILGDIWKRRVIIVGGGIVFTLALLLTSASNHFLVLLVASILLSPASGAFVGLSESTLMDTEPKRHEQNMARWTFAGSLGVVAGSLVLGLLAALGFGWRPLFAFAALFALVLLIAVRGFPFNGLHTADEEEEYRSDFKTGVRNALDALRRREVLRWLLLLVFSDLMLDGLHGYLALYFVDVVAVSEVQASQAIAVWTGIGLLGDLLIIPLLERVRGLSYLRISVVLELILFPAFLLAPGLAPKLVILALLGLFNSGWYSILRGQLYTSMPGQSGTVMTVSNVFGLVGSLIPLGIGIAAEHWGLHAAMWLFLFGPIALLVGLPHGRHG